jgi:hypothetical protein
MEKNFNDRIAAGVNENPFFCGELLYFSFLLKISNNEIRYLPFRFRYHFYNCRLR